MAKLSILQIRLGLFVCFALWFSCLFFKKIFVLGYFISYLFGTNDSETLDVDATILS